MIYIDKIEAAAKAAPYEAPWRYEPTGQTVWAGNTYMVADIRGWGHLQYMLNGEKLQDATGVHIATANPATVLEMVSMIRERDVTVVELRCQVMTLATQVADLQMKAIERDAVLKQALEALNLANDYDTDGAKRRMSAIAAIKGVLNERPD